MYARLSLGLLLLCLLQACGTTAPLNWQQTQSNTEWLAKRVTFQIIDKSNSNSYLLVIESPTEKQTNALILNALGMLHTSIHINDGELTEERSSLANKIMNTKQLLAVVFLSFDQASTSNTLLAPWIMLKQPQGFILKHKKHGQFEVTKKHDMDGFYQVINDESAINLLIKKISSEPL